MRHRLPERRRHIRILTIKNFAGFLGAVVLVVIAANVVSEIRAPHGDGYGRLFARQAPDVDAPKPAPQVVHEADVPDAERADPMLIAPMARAQYLGEPQLTPAVNTAQTVAAPAPAGRGKLEIVGGASGVSIVRSSQAAAPKLSGGIFKGN